MRGALKIVTIGGGSSYTPELVEGFITRYDQLPLAEHWFVDIEDGRDKVETVTRMAQRMWDASGHDVKVRVTYDRREALVGADFVTTQFRVGLLQARIKDERIPLSYGILGQETNGAGGIFKALRTIPVMQGLVEDMRELCPDAWLINFTNPSGMVTEAVIRNFGWTKTIGLCNVPIRAEIIEGPSIDHDPAKLVYQCAGLNHFHWHRVYDETGKERTAELIEKINGPDSPIPANIEGADLPLNLLHTANLLPCGYHRYYVMTQEMLEHQLVDYTNHTTRAETVKRIEDELFALYADPNLDHKPEQLALRGGAHYSDAACGTIAAIYNNSQVRMTVSTENRGAIRYLPDDCIVEVSSIISAIGAEPLVWGEMRPHERGWLQVMKAMEECAIKAAIEGDYGALLEAFDLNPVIPNGRDARRVMHELLLAHERYLPQFADVIARLKAEGVTIRDETSRQLVAEGR